MVPAPRDAEMIAAIFHVGNKSKAQLHRGRMNALLGQVQSGYEMQVLCKRQALLL